MVMADGEWRLGEHVSHQPQFAWLTHDAICVRAEIRVYVWAAPVTLIDSRTHQPYSSLNTHSIRPSIDLWVLRRREHG